MPEYPQQNTDYGNSFIVGAIGIFASFFFVIMGWESAWILFGVIIIGALLQESKFFATGVVGATATGIFTGLNMFPTWAYFTVVVIAALLLAVKIAGMYINTGQTK